MGFASSGLHTNGFSLARKALFEVGSYSVHDSLSELDGKKLGHVLLEPHVNYTKAIFALLDNGITIKGVSHITGGGFVENIPRILPEKTAVEIDRYSFPVPAIFELIQKTGTIEDKEMYRTFNMGVGMVVVVKAEDKQAIFNLIDPLPFDIYEIGRVVEGNQEVNII